MPMKSQNNLRFCGIQSVLEEKSLKCAQITALNLKIIGLAHKIPWVIRRRAGVSPPPLFSAMAGKPPPYAIPPSISLAANAA